MGEINVGMDWPAHQWQLDDTIRRTDGLRRAGPNVRHYDRPHVRMQYGLSDSALTNALEGGEFYAAEKLILLNTEPEFLDEGPFDRIPLAIVLTDDPVFRQFPRNLRLARLLVERGADPNLRIPMAEMQRSSPSPMEYLVKFCEEAMKHFNAESDTEQSETFHEVIGLQNENTLNTYQLKDQLLEVLGVFLAHGGDPNVISTSAHSTVYHMALRNPEPSLELVLRLCEAGGDLNQCNAHRTTPLMDLVTYAEFDSALEILSGILEVNPDISSLAKQNCCQHTALWRAMLSGSPRVAMELLKRGADLAPRALVSQGGCYRSRKFSRSILANAPWSVSALYAPLLGNSTPYIHFGCVTDSPKESMPADLLEFNVDLFNKVMAHSIHPLIDSAEVSFFELSLVLMPEFEHILEAQTQFEVKQLVSPIRNIQEVAEMMFGHMKAGLQQMCVRQILRQIVGNAGGAFSKTHSENVSADQEVSVKDHWMLVQELNPSFIQCLVTEDLKLPPALLWRFKIEAARLQLGACLFTLETVECFQACDGESDEGSALDSLDGHTDNGMELEDDDDSSSWLSASSVYELESGMFEGWVPSRTRISGFTSSSTDSSSDSTEDSSSEDAHEEDIVIELVADTGSLPQAAESSSAESVPHSIPRDEYEQFSNEIVNSDISPSDVTSEE